MPCDFTPVVLFYKNFSARYLIYRSYLSLPQGLILTTDKLSNYYLNLVNCKVNQSQRNIKYELSFVYKPMIPKTIYYCWFSNEPKPDLMKKCFKSWEKIFA